MGRAGYTGARRLARPLVESLRNEVVCSEHDIAGYMPDPPDGLLTLDQAITLALRYTRDGAVSTRWSSAATPGAPSDPLPTDPSWAGGSLYVDARNSVVRASPAALWRVIEGIGGETGWYSFPAAWAVRGVLDRLAGGVGLRRGRRDRRHLLGRRGSWISGGWRRSSRESYAAARGDEATGPGLAGAVGGPGL